MITAEIFDCTLRLGGHMTHTVGRRAISDKEIKVLNAMHGQDSVVDLRKVGERQVEERELLYELVRKYSTTSDTLTNTDGKRLTGRRLIERLFGVELLGYDDWLEDQVEMEKLERDERHEKAQREIKELAAARAVAEAEVRAKFAREQAAAA